MENKTENSQNTASVKDETLENVAGGNLKYVLCETCGRQLPVKGPMGNYYGNNICPFCHGLIKKW